jgi:zinc protease
MKWALFTLCLTLAATVAPAQDRKASGVDAKPSEKTPAAARAASVEAIIDRYLQALGGKAALEKVTSRLTRSMIVPREGESIGVETYWKAPDRWLQVIDDSDEGLVRSGYDGKVGWTQDSQGRVREMTGSVLAAVRHSSAFFQQARIRELYPKMTLKGPGKVGDRAAQIIEAARADGTPETLYFDTESGLLIRRDVVRQTAEGRQTTETTYEDYRVIDGVRIPFLTRQRRGPAAPDLTIKVSEVKHNVAAEDARFSKPAS